MLICQRNSLIKLSSGFYNLSPGLELFLCLGDYCSKHKSKESIVAGGKGLEVDFSGVL